MDASDVDPMLRPDLVTRILLVIETFTAEHRLELDFFGRLELLDVCLEDIESTHGSEPTHQDWRGPPPSCHGTVA